MRATSSPDSASPACEPSNACSSSANAVMRRTMSRSSIRASCLGIESQFAELLAVDEQATPDAGEGCPRPLVVLRRQRGGHVLFEPVEMLVDEPADLLVGCGAPPQIGRRSAGHARHARERRESERLVLLDDHPGPGPQVVSEP